MCIMDGLDCFAVAPSGRRAGGSHVCAVPASVPPRLGGEVLGDRTMTTNHRGATRRQILNALGVAGAAAALRPLSALGQAAARKPIIGFLLVQSRDAQADQIDA